MSNEVIGTIIIVQQTVSHKLREKVYSNKKYLCVLNEIN